MEKLRELAAPATVELDGQSYRVSALSKALMQDLEHQPLAPLFELLVYRLTSRRGTGYLVRFDTLSFLNALDERLYFFLNHVDECLTLHDQSLVLVSEIL